MVKFKVDEESDSDGLFSDDDMSYDTSDSDTSDVKVTGGYYTMYFIVLPLSSSMSLVSSTI